LKGITAPSLQWGREKGNPCPGHPQKTQGKLECPFNKQREKGKEEKGPTSMWTFVHLFLVTISGGCQGESCSREKWSARGVASWSWRRKKPWGEKRGGVTIRKGQRERGGKIFGPGAKPQWRRSLSASIRSREQGNKRGTCQKKKEKGTCRRGRRGESCRILPKKGAGGEKRLVLQYRRKKKKKFPTRQNPSIACVRKKNSRRRSVKGRESPGIEVRKNLRLLREGEGRRSFPGEKPFLFRDQKKIWGRGGGKKKKTSSRSKGLSPRSLFFGKKKKKRNYEFFEAYPKPEEVFLFFVGEGKVVEENSSRAAIKKKVLPSMRKGIGKPFPFKQPIRRRAADQTEKNSPSKKKKKGKEKKNSSRSFRPPQKRMEGGRKGGGSEGKSLLSLIWIQERHVFPCAERRGRRERLSQQAQKKVPTGGERKEPLTYQIHGGKREEEKKRKEKSNQKTNEACRCVSQRGEKKGGGLLMNGIKKKYNPSVCNRKGRSVNDRYLQEVKGRENR